MGSAVANISEEAHWRIGEDRIFRWRVYELADPYAEDVPANRQVPAGIATWGFAWTLRSSADDPTPVLAKVPVLTDANTGTVEMPILSSETADLLPGRYVQALWRNDVGADWELAAGFAILSYGAGGH
jgi:hypothetical protein